VVRSSNLYVPAFLHGPRDTRSGGTLTRPPPSTPSHIHITPSQLVQIVQARNLASRRGARYLSAEDLIFLIRHDRAKVNRLRTYLSWKDVRRHAKDSGGDGAAGMEVETLEDGADGELSR